LLEMRIRKANVYIYKSIYYSAVSAWGFILMKDLEIYPTYLGGTG